MAEQMCTQFRMFLCNVLYVRVHWEIWLPNSGGLETDCAQVRVAVSEAAAILVAEGSGKQAQTGEVIVEGRADENKLEVYAGMN